MIDQNTKPIARMTKKDSGKSDKNIDDDSFKNTIQSIGEKESNEKLTKSISFNEKFIVKNIDNRLESEAKRSIDNISKLLSYFQAQIKSQKNNITTSNENRPKNSLSPIQNTVNLSNNSNINNKFHELYEFSVSLTNQNKQLEKKLKNLSQVLMTEIEEKNKISKSLSKNPSKNNLNDEKNPRKIKDIKKNGN